MNIVVNDLMVNYQLTGKGPLVLLLHGWGDNLQGLSGLSRSLSDKYQILVLDLPGFGNTQAPKEAWDLDNYAEFVHATLEKLSLGKPYAVIGHSNGGALAIRAISLKQLQPEKLILMAASGVRTNNKYKRLFIKFIAKVGNVATIWMPERYRRDLRKSLYGVAGSDMLVAPHLQDTFKRTVRQDVQADAVAINVPTLLIYADKDEAIPVEDGKQYHDLISGSKLEIIHGAGHFVHLDKTDEVTGKIMEFLR